MMRWTQEIFAKKNNYTNPTLKTDLLIPGPTICENNGEESDRLYELYNPLALYMRPR